jgi:predicted SnoaL-like aldol condensation-catalyzing enzyme
MTSTDVFRAYLERFTGGDVEGAAELLADDFTFRGPMVQTDSKAEFLASTTPVAAVARGVKIHHAWADGDDVCMIYDFEIETPAGAGSVLMAEWAVIRDGKLVSSRLVFDTAAFMALMPTA